MKKDFASRRDFLRLAGTAACAAALPHGALDLTVQPAFRSPEIKSPDYILRIGASPVEIAPKHIVSTITYNGKFPGPLLRFREGQPAIVEVHNDTDTPEQLHWPNSPASYSHLKSGIASPWTSHFGAPAGR